MKEETKDVRSYLEKYALPFWGDTGAYSNGCFVEFLDLAGRPVDPGYTRVRVQARQLFVFSHAEYFGLYSQPGLTSTASEFFLNSCWQGSNKGWAKLIDRNGAVLDGSSDLYDIAFALLALAWRYRVSHEPRCLEIARQTICFLDQRMAHTSGGYLNDDGASQPRQQNPHMHLTESMIAWADATGDIYFLEQAKKLIKLLQTRFVNDSTGALGEYFLDDWSSVDQNLGDIVEPGHQFEWVWIIAQYCRLNGSDIPDLAYRMLEFARNFGLSESTGLTVNRVGRGGAVLDAGHRLWPQTEALKAHIASAEWMGGARLEAIGQIVRSIFDVFLEPASRYGTWIDQYDAEGRPTVDRIPASSLYHLHLAFCEFLRFSEQGVGRS